MLWILAAQYALVQLATGAMYGDAPRNLHWGLLTAEQPRFLIGQPDPYQRVLGFAPPAPEFAPRGLYNTPAGALHPWWGPVAPLLFAAVWISTHSYILLRLVVPVVAGAAVLLVFRMADRLYGRRQAWLAAAFFACFPLYRDYASTAYIEAFSTAVLAAALYAYWQGRTGLAVPGGALAMYTKMDLVVLYTGVVGISAFYALLRHDARLPRRHHLIALIAPVLLAAPWIMTHYLPGRTQWPGQGESITWSRFLLVAPQMLDLLFYTSKLGALLALAAIGAGVGLALRARATGAALKLFLGSWLGLAVLVTLVYAATPGSGNSPRIFLPGLPPLALLFADGFFRLHRVWQRRIGFFLMMLFAIVNLVVIGYYAVHAARVRAYAPVWATLREQPRGFVLAEPYWETILYARQPTTWFESDPVFERNIMRNVDHFAAYVAAHPIRYVVLPATGDELAAAEVYAYLNQRADQQRAGAYIIYTLRN